MTDDPLARLARWLEPYSVTSDRSAIEARSLIVEGLAESDAVDAQTLVAAAHNYWTDDIFQTVVDVCATIDPSVVLHNKRQLTATLAAAALIIRLDDIDDIAAVSALLTQSAAFLGLNPAIPDLTAAAESTLSRCNRDRRTRIPLDKLPEVLANLLTPASSDDVDVDDEDDKEDDADSEASVVALTRRVEAVITSVTQRFELLEEELDLLWWTRRSVSTTANESSDKIPLARRTVLAATEIMELLVRLPAPPSIRTLLRDVLGDQADSSLTVADVGSVTEVPEGALNTPLTPLISYRLYSDTLDYDAVMTARAFDKRYTTTSANAKHTAIDMAEQLLQNLQVVELL